MSHKFTGLGLVFGLVSACGSTSGGSEPTSCDIALQLSSAADGSAATEQFGDVIYKAKASSSCVSLLAFSTGVAKYSLKAAAATSQGYINKVTLDSSRSFDPTAVTAIITDNSSAAPKTFSAGTIEYTFTSKELNNKGSGITPDTIWTLPYASLSSSSTVTATVEFKMPKPLNSALYPTAASITIELGH
jgi:hypothetical protein